MKSTKLYSQMLLVKSSNNIFISSPAIYLIMCLMNPQRILKKYHFDNMRAGFLKGVKIQFGKLALK